MPKRDDLNKIMIIGSGPIIISQACEFDYSGTQAVKALTEEGIEVVLVNSNPATIMTDPELAHRTYVEPITPEVVAKIIEKERPDALLPTLGGQTGLNVAKAVAESGILDTLGVEMIGATLEVINKAEDRDLFREAMRNIGLRVPRSGIAYTLSEAKEVAEELGFPLIVRPSFTLGGTGGGAAFNMDDLEELAAAGLDASMIGQVMLEESVLGWKEFELEVMRDVADNVVIICSIENFDPMGVHTGDSITVAPAQTLTDFEYQRMRDAAIAIIREIGVETGGSNIQFALNPRDGEMVVIEMNPRVSRSSALASKATGFPIARIAAKLAIGYTLDEIPNDITRETMASFEPAIDYCVVKIPRFTFEKFPDTRDVLTTSMKSVGETMAIGRTFKEALQKAVRGLEIGRNSLGLFPEEERVNGELKYLLREKLGRPNSLRPFYLFKAVQHGFTTREIYHLTGIDPWFVENLRELVECEKELASLPVPSSLRDYSDQLPLPLPFLDAESLREIKSLGFSDGRLAELWSTTEEKVAVLRRGLGVRPVYKLVDTCAAEFEAYTPYYYSTYETECEAEPQDVDKVVILGGGPNRIGQGIEFDYCCCHASFALKEMGVQSIMVNSNPETVSTDYDTSDRLYFEPLTLEDVLHIIEKERPKGVIVQFGGQTPLNLAVPLAKRKVPILGTSPDAIDRAEDRRRFQELLYLLGLKQPANGTATLVEDAVEVAEGLGYPVVVRPSYVLGGRAMEIVYNDRDLVSFMAEAVKVSPGHPVLLDKFLEDAIEIDVDAISDGSETVVAGIMEHVEQAGVHSGDSACVLPPVGVAREMVARIRADTRALAKELGVVGLMNVQYAIKDKELYVLEVNPRASRTVPFVSKAVGIPLAKMATKVMMGHTLKELGLTEDPAPAHLSVKEAVFPFNRFPGVDVLLGPEMRSTGEVMGLDRDFGLAFAKAQLAAGSVLPESGTVFISVADPHKDAVLDAARGFRDLGFEIVATRGTSQHLEVHGIANRKVNKIREGRPNVLDHVTNREIHLLVNTALGKSTTGDSFKIRRAALLGQVPYITTIRGAKAAVEAVRSKREKGIEVTPLQEYHR